MNSQIYQTVVILQIYFFQFDHSHSQFWQYKSPDRLA